MDQSFLCIPVSLTKGTLSLDLLLLGHVCCPMDPSYGSTLLCKPHPWTISMDYCITSLYAIPVSLTKWTSPLDPSLICMPDP